jgi:hypothetical protein
MDGPTYTPGDRTGHSDLAPDQPVSLRQSEPQIPRPVPQAIDLRPTAVDAPPTAVATTEAAAPAAPFALTADDYEPGQAPAANAHQANEVTWTASEFIAHEKTSAWYLGLAGVTVVLSALGFLITRDLFTIFIIVFCAGIFGYMAARQPRQLEYGLSPSGIHIGPKFYPYGDFTAFAVIEEGKFSSIDFMPMKRFAPILSIYYDPAQEASVLEVLSQHLPFANHKRTAVDELMHKIRF